MPRAGRAILWEVDVQSDFMLPDGKLYVPGAEKIITNINALVDSARKNRVFLVSSGDAHNPEDPELKQWPPHCIKGTPGAALLPEACAEPRLVIPNRQGFVLPNELEKYRQVTLEKNTLDVFDNPNTALVLARLDNSANSGEGKAGTQFVVFGVATDYCVKRTTEGLLHRGKRVAIVTDAVRAIEPEKEKQLLDSWRVRGAQLFTAKEALAFVEVMSSERGGAKVDSGAW